MKHPLISVAMCTYNGARYLSEQLDSILNQSRLPDEIIICDDVSSDGTLKILEQYKSQYPDMIMIYSNSKNLGYIKNFEKAISLASGDIIFLSDQDDVWHLDKVMILSALLENDSKSGYVFTDAELIDDCSKKMNESLWSKVHFDTRNQQKFAGKDNQLHMLLIDKHVTGATLAFKGKYKNLFLPFPVGSDFVHDAWVAVILSFYGHYGIACKQRLTFYRRHAQQQLGCQDPDFWANIKRRSLIARWRIQAVSNRVKFFQEVMKALPGSKASATSIHTVDELYAYLCKRKEILSVENRFRRLGKIYKLLTSGLYAKYSMNLTGLGDFVRKYRGQLD